jgi:hypothetical protein
VPTLDRQFVVHPQFRCYLLDGSLRPNRATARDQNGRHPAFRVVWPDDDVHPVDSRNSMMSESSAAVLRSFDMR